jgi:membrane protein implicated in regulation of membrane protease activity
MFFVDWWNSIGIISQIFYCIAVPSTLILLIQTILMFIGFGEEADGAGEDISDGDIDDVTEITDDTDVSGLEGLKIFTIRGIIAFLVLFGRLGIVMNISGAALWLIIPVATVCGFAMMLLLAYLLRLVMKLRSDGNLDNRNAIGATGKVYLTIPPSRHGEGKVQVMLQGSYVERNAVTDEEEPIPTGYEIIVVGTSGQTNLVVRTK